MFSNAALHSPDRTMAASPFRIDEGFSEEMRDGPDWEELSGLQRDSAGPADGEASQVDSAKQWLYSQSAVVRTDIARDLLASLPTSTLAELVREANIRLHFDPALCLPPELIASIFEYLDPPSLFNASLVSKLWRNCTNEPRLWKRLFSLEGWSHDAKSIGPPRRNPSQLRGLGGLSPTKRGGRRLMDAEDKRYRPNGGGLLSPRRRSQFWNQNGSRQGLPRSGQEDEMMIDVSEAQSIQPEPMQMSPGLEQNLGDTLKSGSEADWRWLYKQRRRLEANWSAGRFTNFRLPHIDHPNEAHLQCVYTVQFSSRHVVTGSRDKTVRIWDLETRRLKVPPLRGHSGSVLCLQFDDRPGQDIVVSGGSDSDVFIWQLSTGLKIRHLRQAHSESVLNLRFDDRYLVTCSKDKTIRLWNRRILRPTDPEYPPRQVSPNAEYPEYIINPMHSAPSPQPRHAEPLAPYTLLMTFSGHGAAVNAIQIHSNHLVSASGDRKIILWDIPSGTLVRTFAGHLKGIACVQYDGRRIVSGSSDNTVRIFDSECTAEVALLEGHRHLVRTVQAEFGDAPGWLAEEYEAARENDRNIESATGAAPYWVYGTRIPPGGGGNRWSKIVSGSYDETVMIWRRDKEGKWIVAKELRQEDAMRATGGPTHRNEHHHRRHNVQNAPALPQPQLASINQTLPHRPSDAAVDMDEQAEGGGTPSTILDPLQPANAAGPSANPAITQYHNTDLNDLAAQRQHQSVLPSQPPLPPTQPAGQQQQQLAAFALPGQQDQQGAAQGQQEGGASRVFKLQFDSRRIICCSQQPVIVGWDFANGDEDIIEACKQWEDSR